MAALLVAVDIDTVTNSGKTPLAGLMEGVATAGRRVYIPTDT
jgi:hypothetical protein